MQLEKTNKQNQNVITKHTCMRANTQTNTNARTHVIFRLLALATPFRYSNGADAVVSLLALHIHTNTQHTHTYTQTRKQIPLQASDSVHVALSKSNQSQLRPLPAAAVCRLVCGRPDMFLSRVADRTHGPLPSD